MLCWDQTRQPVCPTGSATGGGIEGLMSGCEGWWCHCPLDAVPRGDMGRKGTRAVGQGGPESWGFCGGLHRQLPPRPKPSSTPRTAPLPLPALNTLGCSWALPSPHRPIPLEKSWALEAESALSHSPQIFSGRALSHHWGSYRAKDLKTFEKICCFHDKAYLENVNVV